MEDGKETTCLPLSVIVISSDLIYDWKLKSFSNGTIKTLSAGQQYTFYCVSSKLK
jgi:hypothetical protein